MSERSLIAVTGAGGSGKTNLSRRLRDELDRSGEVNPFTVDHISIGEYIRDQAKQALGRGVLVSSFREDIIDHMNNSPFVPMNKELIVGILVESLLRSDADAVLLDGFPRFGEQVEELYEASAMVDIYTRAAVITYVDDDEAVRRMLKREGSRIITKEDARERLRVQHLGLQAVKSVFVETNLPHTSIDMAQTREQTLAEAVTFVAPILDTDPQTRQAS